MIEIKWDSSDTDPIDSPGFVTGILSPYSTLELVFGVLMKILVRNLFRETTEAELLALFEEYGDVQYCTLVMDKVTGKSKGFGFVEMPRVGEAKAAIKGLNYRDVGGNKIRVKKAEKSEGPRARD